MEIYYNCSQCRSQNILPFKVSSRFDIETTANCKIVAVCEICSESNHVSLNEIRAKESMQSKIAYVISLWIAILIGTGILFSYWDDDLGVGLVVLEVFGIGIIIPVLVASVIIRKERKSVNLFNSHYV